MQAFGTNNSQFGKNLSEKIKKLPGKSTNFFSGRNFWHILGEPEENIVFCASFLC